MERDRSLSHYLPAPERPHTILHVPGSHTLYVGPSSCTRRHALRSERYGGRDQESFLFLTETDIISGEYERVLGDAVEDLLHLLEPSPYIFFLAVFCIDDFLGTDETALLERLKRRFPDRQFSVEHIDPVTMDAKNDSMKRKVNRYAFLTPDSRRDASICVLGSYSSYDPDCEIHTLLSACGVEEVRELFRCETFEEYQGLARCRLALGTRFVGEEERDFFTDTLQIPYYYFPTSYDADYVLRGYREIARLLGGSVPEHFERLRAEAVEDARKTAAGLGDLPLAVDSSACMMPFAAAQALLQYGFQVRWIFHRRRISEVDERAQAWVCREHPEVVLLRADDPETEELLTGAHRCLALGADSRRLLQASYFADLWHDEGYFGFHGIRRLMALIRGALSGEKEG